MAVQLRRADGIDRVRFRVQTGFDLDELAGDRLPSLVREGLLNDDGDRVRFLDPDTERDEVTARLAALCRLPSPLPA